MKSKGKIVKTAFHLLLMYTTIYYFIPFLFSLFWWEEFSTTYKMSDNLWVMLLIPITIFLVYLVNIIIPKFNFGISNWLGLIFYKPSTIIFFSIAMVLVSIWFSNTYTLSFRQQNILSDVGGLAMALFALKVYFRAYLFGLLLKYAADVKFTKFDKGILLLIIVCFTLTIMGSFDVIYILTAILLFFDVKKILGKVSDKKDVVKRFFKQFAMIFGVAVLVLGILFVGMANKIGVESAKNLFSNFENVGYLFQHLVLRLSTLYVSLLASADHFFQDAYFAFPAIQGSAQNAYLRIGILAGENLGDRPEVWSINRMNYLNIFVFDYNDRTGATPGIYSMLFYIPFFPLSMFFVVGYILYILRSISSCLSFLKLEVNIFLFVIMLLYMAPLFENPLAYINILDTAFLYFLFFIASLSHIKSSILKTQK